MEVVEWEMTALSPEGIFLLTKLWPSPPPLPMLKFILYTC